MSKRKLDANSVGGYLAENDNTQSALKKIKMPLCTGDECTHQTGLLLEWPCRKRHVICAHCLFLKIAETSGWEKGDDNPIGAAKNIVCCIGCPRGCADSEVKFHEPGAMDKVRPLHPEWAKEWLAGCLLECPACHHTSNTTEEFLDHAGDCKKLTSVPCPACHQQLTPSQCANHGEGCAAFLLHKAVMTLSMSFAAPILAVSPAQSSDQHGPLAAFVDQPASALKFSQLALEVFPKLQKVLNEPKKLLLIMGGLKQMLRQSDQEVDKMLADPENGMGVEVRREQGLVVEEDA